MTRPRRATLPCLLVLAALGPGCDDSAKAPDSSTPPATSAESKTAPKDPPTPAVPAPPSSPPTREDADPAAMALVSFTVEAPQQLTPVAVTAEVTLTRDVADHTRVILVAACQLDGSTYVDSERELLIGDTSKRGAKIAFDTRLFGGRLYREGDPLGDCDFWLSTRVVIPDTGGQYREYPLGTRCLRAGKALDTGCAAFPTVTAPKPLTESSVSISIIRTEAVLEEGEERGYVLDFVAELTGKQAVAPRWDLEGDVVCQGGGKSTHRHDTLLGVDVQELGPGQKSRGDLTSRAKPEETLDVPPEQCEIAITGTRNEEDGVIALGKWCYLPAEPIRVGPCPAAGA